MGGTALVTGGTGGLGTAVTGELLRQGWRVVVPWNSPGSAEHVQEHDNLDLIKADLFEEGDAASVAGRAAADPDAPLRAVVNLVGGFAMGGRVHEAPVADFEQQLRLNLRPAYLTSQAAIPHLIDSGGGSVVCVSSKAALKPFPGGVGYVTSKAALLAFVDTLAVEYKGKGIRSNAVLPGMIDTPANRAGQPNADRSNWTAPEDIASVIAFLCAGDSSVVNGAHVPV
ncbi:NAD(P)-dependent dehydrogenase, short-chain alcohol dehydrogenase family [Haloechinothrix alba]|uniref:NAD(P)-dependent dehydrogenase, short-chain alcohol dehydrogenase family n=1 Tax=Haloechinothrix alba TaxID=664784 RepID=A0A238VPZ8_9PSEU|nr:SDR family NAD(P)-dependent oxidoreductase [Haloechinothrix alba]SNR36440.1 NAD(P)-dependent dehydrogenase, short-chain alcohol dehydrogenase family [Haloechinothrix alba]